MDCNVRCEPFGRAPKTRYRFVGRSRLRPEPSLYPSSIFKVEKVCRADSP